MTKKAKVKLRLNLPFKVETANWWMGAATRGSRFERARRARVEREYTWAVVRKAMLEQHRTRIARANVNIVPYRSRIMDSDAWEACVKHFRDGIACALDGRGPHDHAPDGPNDGYKWSASQEKIAMSEEPYILVEIDER